MVISFEQMKCGRLSGRVWPVFVGFAKGIGKQRFGLIRGPKGPPRNNVYKYDAGILASGKTPARSISAWIRNERATCGQWSKDQVRLERLFLGGP